MTAQISKKKEVLTKKSHVEENKKKKNPCNKENDTFMDI